MSDNTQLNTMSGGDVIATDDIAGVKHQLVKIEYGAADSATPVDGTNKLPVTAAVADGADVTQGAKADAKSTATDTTAVTVMQVLKEISYMEQNPASRAVTNAGTFATQATLQAGTAAIGKLLPPDIDVTTHTNYARKYYTNAGAVTDGIIWSPAAGKRWHVVTMYIQTSAAATVTLEDDKAGGDDPVWKGELAANGGAVLSFTEQYPMASGEDAADLIVTTSAGNIYITVVGYEI